MKRRPVLRGDEHLVVVVTPTPRGVVVPFLVTVVATVAVVAASQWSFIAAHALIVALVVIGPCAAVLGARIVRWRSGAITVTNQRVIMTEGVGSRRVRDIELIEVIGGGVDQRWFERVTRRGDVVVQTPSGVIGVGRVRRPDALWRVIDHQRLAIDRRDWRRLERGDELSQRHESGEITDDDYEERWRHLFGPGGIRG